MHKRFSKLVIFTFIISLIPWFRTAAFNGSTESETKKSIREHGVPQFKPPSGNYLNRLRFSIKNHFPLSRIYYTIDGTKPTTESTLYLGSVLLDQSATIKAVAIDKEGGYSPVVTAKYSIVGEHSLITRGRRLSGQAMAFKNTSHSSESSSQLNNMANANAQLLPKIKGTKTNDHQENTLPNTASTNNQDLSRYRSKSAIKTAVAETPYIIELSEGWNPISIPVETSMTVDDIFPADGESPLLITGVFSLVEGEYVEITGDSQLEPGRGYWVYSPSGGASNPIVGSVSRSGSDIIPKAWSLIGPVEGVNWEDYNFTAIWGWDGGAYTSVSLEEIEFGKAYWVFFSGVESIEEIVIPEGFDFQTIQSHPISLAAELPDGRIYAHARFIVENENGDILFEGFTDEHGLFKDALRAFSGQKIFYRFASIGLPTDLVEVNAGEASEVAAEVAPISKSAKAEIGSGVVKDNAVINHKETVSVSFLKDINAALPERRSGSTSASLIDPTLPNAFQGTNVYVSEDETDIYVTFVHEGAGYRNSFGYFTWQHDSNDPNLGIPQTVSEITYVPIFPNASYSRSGGLLASGDTVYLGQFAKGTWIGFWNVSNGWNQGVKKIEGDPLSTAGIDVRNRPGWIFYSLPHLNLEYEDEHRRELSQHIAVLWHEQEHKMVLAFEDILRTARGCDHDFNDVVFYVSAQAPESIDPKNNPINDPDTEIATLVGPKDSDNDGVADTLDSHPNDPERAIVQAPQEGKIAFEDNFPSKGDYDFNDMVMQYSLTEIEDSQYRVKEFSIEFELLAMGAEFHNAFGLLIDTDESNIERVELLINGVPPFFSVVESGHENETSLIIIPDAYDHFQDWILGTHGRFPNTWVRENAFQGDTFQLNVIFRSALEDLEWPYNPYLITQNQLKLVQLPNKRLEVHLMNEVPSIKMNQNKFNSEDDGSDIENGITFRDKNGLPWALILPKCWDHPAEFQEISACYPQFVSWAMSGGRNSLRWYKTQKVMDQIWMPLAYRPQNDNFNANELGSIWKIEDQGADISHIRVKNGELVITAKAADIWNNTNQYACAYREVTGDFVAEAKITYQQNTHPWAKAGILLKNDMTVARNNICFVARTPANGHVMQFDRNNNGRIDTTKFGFNSRVSGEATPSWVRMQRSGNTIICSMKKNEGDPWTEIRSKSFPNLNATVHIGLFNVSHNTRTAGEVRFDDFIFRLVR